VRDAVDGWELALDELASDPERFLARLRRLGEVTGRMHTVLGAEPSDPTFCPEEPSSEALALLTATVDEEIQQIFLELPEELDALEPIRGRGEEVRERLARLSHVASFGRVIRHHGDYHLGQTLFADDDWVVLDFEGEPARSLPDRRRKRSPLRDVAGMLRSFAYAVSAAGILRGTTVPGDWELRAREEFLAGYDEAVDPSLIPTGRAAIERLLTIFELEKAVYELRYELNNRPEWIGIPVAAIARMLEDEHA
jgi:trehalose synthase-fused probable maltokinase